MSEMDALIPPKERNFVGTGDFVVVGRFLLDLFCRYGGLQPRHRVLDAGCGVGRMALPLAGFLDEHGSYEGFDVVRDGVKWCQERYAARYPRFRFRHANLFQASYNPRGRAEAFDFDFPYPDEDFDFAFLTSVFTHMVPEDVENYLWQVARTLKLGATCFCTWLLVNNQSSELVRRGRSFFPVLHHSAGYWTDTPAQPECGVFFDEDYVRGLYAAVGLELAAVHPGTWCGRDSGVTFQNIVIARKTAR